MEIDPVHSDSEGTAPWDSSSASSPRERSPSETTLPRAKEETKKARSNTRSQLRDCLENVHDDRFATSGPLPNAANPGIFVQSVGLVGLPLSSRDAEAIIDTVHTERVQAEYSASTVSPPTGSWNLMPGQFEIQNPAWQQTLTEAMEKTAKALGLGDQIQTINAEIAHLRICRPDDSVNDQQQETASAGFLSLMMSLPSEHTGGKIVVGFEERKEELETAPGSKFECSYFSWYSDTVVTKHVIQTGYRLMLVYKLVLSEPGITLSAACFNDAQQKLNDVLGNWEQEIASHTGQAPRNLVHLLESSDLGLDLLEDEDHLKACRLMTACQTRGFCFFWATMKYTFTRYLDEANYNGDHCPCCLQLTNDPDAWDGSEERSCRLLAIHAPDGQSLARDVKIDQLSVIQDHVFGPNAEPDEYDTAGRSIRGDRWNDSESDGGSFQHGLTYIYHRNCVLLVPRAFRFEFLFKGKSLDGLSFSVWINILLQEIEGQSLYMASKEELKELCRHIVESWPSMNEHGKESFRNALELVVTAALRLNDPDLFQSTLSYPVAKKLSPMAFDRVGRSVGELELGNWEQSLKTFVLKFPTLRSRYDGFDKLTAGFASSLPDTDTTKGRIKDFTNQMLSALIDPATSCHTLERNDIDVMAKLARRYGEQSIIPLLKANNHQSGLIIAFLKSLYNDLKSQPKESRSLLRTQSAFRTVLGIFIPAFQPTEDRPVSKRRRTDDQSFDEVSGPEFLPDKVNAEELAALIGHCENLTLKPEVESLLRTIRKECTTGNVRTSVYESFLLPMLTTLLSTLPHQIVNRNTARHTKLYQTVCVTYVQRYVGLEAPPPATWSRSPKGCRLSGSQCVDCASLDRFLVHPMEIVMSITTNFQRRTHVEKQLQDQRKKRFLKIDIKMTDPSMSQFMLVITKTDEEWRQDLAQWKARRAAAMQRIEAIGNNEVLSMLLSDGNGLVPELRDLGLFEASQKSAEAVSKPLASGNKRRRESEMINKIHLLD